jgi:hypothetical protein
VLAAYLGDAVLDPDARVHDQALLTRPGGEDVAVRREGRRGEPDGQHPGSLDHPTKFSPATLFAAV